MFWLRKITCKVKSMFFIDCCWVSNLMSSFVPNKNGFGELKVSNCLSRISKLVLASSFPRFLFLPAQPQCKISLLLSLYSYEPSERMMSSKTKRKRIKIWIFFWNFLQLNIKFSLICCKKKLKNLRKKQKVTAGFLFCSRVHYYYYFDIKKVLF